MAADHEIGSFFDIPEISRDAKIVLDEVKSILDLINKINATKIAFQGAEKSKEVVSGINTLNNAITGLSEQVKKTTDQQQKLVETSKKAATAMADEAKEVSDLSGAYGELVKQSVRNSLASKELAAQRKALNEAFKAGRITEQQYINSLAQIKDQEISIAQSNIDLNRSLRNLAKESGAAAGSLDQLRAKLNLATQAYDRLSDHEKKSNVGTQLLGQINNLTRDISTQEQVTGRFQRNVGNYASALKGASVHVTDFIAGLTGVSIGLLGLQQVGSFLSGAIDEFQEAELAAARFQNTLANLGRADVFDRLNNESKRLAETFKVFDDDEILEVFNKLVTFGKLTEDQMTELTPVILNFAAKQRISISDASQEIIKGLQGTSRVLKNEYGINLKEASTTTEAFGIIMKDLKPRIEGAAEAFGDTTAGQIEKTKIQINELKEDVGSKLQPVIGNFYGFLQKTLAFLPTLFNSTLFNTRKLTEAIGFSVNVLKQTVLAGKDFLSGDITQGIGRLTQAVTTDETVFFGELPADTIDTRGKNKKVVGTGNPDDENKGRGKAKRDAAVKESISEVISNLDKERKAKAEFARLQIEEDQKYQDEITSNEKLSLDARLTALNSYTLDKQALVQLDRDLEIAAVNDRMKAIEGIEKKSPQKRTSEEIKLLSDKKALLAQRTNLELEAAIKENDIEVASGKKRLDILKSNLDAETKARLSNYEKIKAQDETAFNEQLIALNEQFASGDIPEKEFNERRLKIQEDYQVKTLEREIKFTKEMLDLAALRGEDVSGAQAKLARLELDLSDLVTKHHIANNEKQAKSDEEKLARIIRGAEQFKGVYDQLNGIVGDYIQNTIVAEKNAIQDQIDTIDQKREAEINAVQASTASEQEKADKITSINAQATAKRQNLETQQKRLDQRKAEFDKAKNIADIVINTALAVMKSVAASPLTGGLPWSAITAGIGAAQLAVAIAQPIPRFKYGKSNDYEGLGIVGDGGRSEAIVREDGSIEYTPSTPTLTYIRKKDKVLPDARMVMSDMENYAYKGLKSMPVFSGTNNLKHLEKKMDRVVEAINNKSTAIIKMGWNGPQVGWKSAKGYTEWVSRNMQSE